MEVLQWIIDGYELLNVRLADPRTNDWFLVSSPLVIIGFLLLYLYFVFKLGPWLMKDRKSYDLVGLMQLYNFLQVLFNTYLFYRVLVYGWLKDFNFWCQPIDFSPNPRAVRMAETVWYYFMLKIFDLLDTVFFVLRKKQSHVSFLHVYHHMGMVGAGWGATKYLPDGHLTFLGLVNTPVHMIMYSYYLISTRTRISAWWKRQITQLQLFQFILILLHEFQPLFLEDCSFPKWPAFIMIPQNVFMIVLFAEFYYNAYVKRPSKIPNDVSKQNSSKISNNSTSNLSNENSAKILNDSTSKTSQGGSSGSRKGSGEVSRGDSKGILSDGSCEFSKKNPTENSTGVSQKKTQ